MLYGDLVQENIQAREDEDAMTSFSHSLLFSFHLRKLSDESQTFILQLEEVIYIKNLKPGSIKVYDYYQPGGLQVSFYFGVGSWVPSCLTGKRQSCILLCVIVFLTSLCRGAHLCGLQCCLQLR